MGLLCAWSPKGQCCKHMSHNYYYLFNSYLTVGAIFSFINFLHLNFTLLQFHIWFNCSITSQSIWTERKTCTEANLSYHRGKNKAMTNHITTCHFLFLSMIKEKFWVSRQKKQVLESKLNTKCRHTCTNAKQFFWERPVSKSFREEKFCVSQTEHTKSLMQLQNVSKHKAWIQAARIN